MSGTKGMDIKTGSKERKSVGTSEAAQTWEQNGRSEVLLELSNSEITKKVTQLLFTETPPPKAVGIIITPHITVPHTNFVWVTAPSSGPGPRFLPSCGSKFPMCLHYFNQCKEKEYGKPWVFRPVHL